MIHPTICPQCLQADESKSSYCWKCSRSLERAATREEFEHLFGLDLWWTMPDLKAAYHRKASEFHPDKNPGDTEADARFQFVNQAYEGLCEWYGGIHAPRPETFPPPAASAAPAQAGEKDAIEDLAEILHSFYVSRYPVRDNLDSLSRIGMIVIFAILGFFLFARWLVYHYVK